MTIGRKETLAKFLFFMNILLAFTQSREFDIVEKTIGTIVLMHKNKY